MVKSANMIYRIILLLITIILAGCNTCDQKSNNTLEGEWAFLDKYGNYNEALFDKYTYATINRFVSNPPRFRYMVKNDSLWTNTIAEQEEMSPVAGLTWLDENHVVIHTPFVSDTLERLKNMAYTISNTDPKGDSAVFWPAFYKRYESFLISRGIITAEEAEAFLKEQKIPSDLNN